MDKAIFDRAAEHLLPRCNGLKADLAVILGSGWGEALERDRDIVRIPYAEIPGMGAPTVQGHGGDFLFYERAGKRIAAFCGRRHFYEGVGWEAVCMPVELARRLGTRTLLLTNASGGINPALRPGDFVVVKDHVNTVGLNPLIGPQNPDWGVRFPDMSSVYAPELRKILREAAAAHGQRVMEGVYAFTTGPVYETPAEVRAYGRWGADIVGMSTVPEAVFARACGFRTACLSLVTNFAAGIAERPLAHAEVIGAAECAKPIMRALVDDFIATAASSPDFVFRPVSEPHEIGAVLDDHEHADQRHENLER